jgi:lysophospholipid acyltransferase (LPLAT)-like uncharacterized protein
MLKALLGNPVFQFLVGRTIGLYMLLVGWTTRWTYVNRAAIDPISHGGKKSLLCIWHGRFMLIHRMWVFDRGATKARMLISRSREGGVVAHASQTVGADVVRGSTAKRGQQRGGAEAGREIVRFLNEGLAIGVTPDGPRGPRMRASMGPVQIARLAQAPLAPMAWSTRWKIVAKSWDRFCLPLPFGRGALIWGDLIAPPPPGASAAEMERVRAALEAELNRISAEADRLAGGPVIEPEMIEAAPAQTEPERAAS